MRQKLLIVILMLCLLLLGMSHLLCRYELRKIQNDWAGYRAQTLNSSLTDIQNRFTALEQTSFKVLDELLANTSIVAEMDDWQGLESRIRIFEEILKFSPSLKETARGIAIYNSERECIAWRGWVFNVSPRCLGEGLNGSRFSIIAYSEEGVYAVLCTFVPFARLNSKENAGVAIAFLPLDTNYSVSTKIAGLEQYIKSRSFSEEMLKEQPFLESVKIHFDLTSLDKPEPNSLKAPLRNLNGDRLCSITVTCHVREVVEKKITQQNKKFQQLILSVFILILCVHVGRRLISSKMAGWRKFSVALAGIWVVRYLLMVLNFPSWFLPDLFTSPAIVFFPYLGNLSNSLAQILTTVLAIFLSFWTCLRWLPAFPNVHKRRYSWLLFSGQLALVIALFTISYHGLYFTVLKIVRFSDFQFFSHFFPSVVVLCIYIVVQLLGISLVFFYAWLLKPILVSPWGMCIAGLALVLAAAIGYEIFERAPVAICSISIGVFFLAACVYLKGFPRRYRLDYVLILGMVALGTYAIAIHGARYKMRIEVEDYAETTREENFVSDRIQEALDTFEFEEQQRQRLIHAIENDHSNIAFLLWANSNLVAFDNVEIFVYKNVAAEEIAEDTIGNRPRFAQLSKFSLNMPLSQLRWYHSLISRLDPEAPKIIESIPGHSIPGYGNEARNILFCVAGTPVRDYEDRIIGFIVVLTRYQKLLQAFPLPEVFSTGSPWKNIPLLMASFEGQSMLDIGNPYLSKNFKPDSEVVRLVKEKEQNVWVEEVLEEENYDNLYFPIITPKLNPLPDQEDFEIRVAMIGYKIPSLLSLIFYFLQFFLTGSFFLLVPVWIYKGFVYLLHRPSLWQWPRLRFEPKILIAFLIISGIPVLVMGILNTEKAVDQIWQSYEKNLMEYLENAEKAMREEGYIPMSTEGTDRKGMVPDDNFCRSWGARNHRMLNVYLSHRLCATNRPEMFQTELLSRQIPGEAYYHLMLLKRDIYVTLEPLANYTFVVGYKALSSPQDKRVIVGALAIPMIYKQAEVEREVAEKIAILATISIGILFLVVVTAIILAHQITRPLTKLMEGIDHVSAGDLDFHVSLKSGDEFGQMVNSFNRMTRDLKISREKAIQAEKDAAWREMARQIAHEIKNPLTPMKLSAQHIRKAYQDRSSKFEQILEKGISTIIDAIDSLSRTASSFSEFAKFTMPTLSSQTIYPILEECLQLFSHYREQNIAFESDFEPSLPSVYTDPYHLKRVLINVLTNAVQAIEGREGKIIVSCHRHPAESDMLLISIKDNGCGIPDSLKSHLFQPNFSTKGHGSGLGLALCKRALSKMQGDIAIESEEGKGTTVNIKIPTAREGARDTEQEDSGDV